ncbi:VCP-like ATPase [Halalkalicoccus paucihalophilus]|uniref:VCP-like ATPase n=1 Tax=Halalkalicoccus paucihalophilus TaxID=1008153 RepID=A0A151AEU1_9EURY|nr:CDC48 family AAA ATPase [Halalkalicoccus paucihalophilus]KYH26218.1 VCP-like ATPase [Halalkalicoccus paucihalophilus]
MGTMTLLVKPMEKRAVGERLAMIASTTLEEFGLERGDYVAIEGENGSRAVAKVRPSFNDTPEGAIRLDEDLRRAVGVSTGDSVTVEEVTVRPADRVTVALPEDLPLEEHPNVRTRRALVDRVLTSGQTVVATLQGTSAAGSNEYVPMRVVSTDPAGSVLVEEWTRITISDTPASDLSMTSGGGRDPDAITYDDVGGLDGEITQLREMTELPLRHPELFDALGIDPPRGVLLHGPPGTGKTLLGRAIATETEGYVRTLSASELLANHPDETEGRLREVFEEAEENAPAILFIDELDAITPNHDRGEAERREVARLVSLLDGLGTRERVVVIGTTNSLAEVDPALRRPGRFDREIEIGVPDRAGREEVFSIHTRGVALAEDVDLGAYAESTHGFVGGDIENLIRESAMAALRRVRPELDLDSTSLDPGVLDSLRITDADIRRALRGIEPSALREVFVELPDVSWDDVGGLNETKARLQETVQWPLSYPEAFERVRLTPATGVLLYGPPGTGKTLLAKAVANEADSNFISIKGPELLDKYVGESERGVREIFAKARENAPTVVFFDELDALAAERGGGPGGSNVGERVVSQLLTELDGLEELENVVVIATTNRPELIDDALLRSGRLDRHIHVAEPDEEARREIFAVHTRGKPLAEGVDLDWLASETEGYVGADIEAVCREAATAAVREYVHDGGDVESIVLTRAGFEDALSAVDPSADEGPGRFGEFLG